MHAGARGLAGGPEARQGARTVEVREHPTRDVVGGRRDREPVDRGIETRPAQRLGERREPPVEVVRERWRRARDGRLLIRVILTAIARLTTSRGASSSTNRSPRSSFKRAPCPRSASDNSGRGIAG